MTGPPSIRMRPRELVKRFGGAYSVELGIRLASGNSVEIYRWFLAAILFGARISEVLAMKTYREFDKARLVTPQKIVDAGWDKLVAILDRGGYARYDFKTATKLLDVNRSLLEQYKGDLTVLHRCAMDSSDLEQRLKDLGKGIGDVMVNIFLRELRGIWPNAAPVPAQLVVDAAHDLGLLPGKIKDRKRMLEVLMEQWRADGMSASAFRDFEAALVRYGKALRKRHPAQEGIPSLH